MGRSISTPLETSLRFLVCVGFAALGCTSSAHAEETLRFGISTAEASWTFRGDRFVCALSQRVPDYGEATIRQEAGLGTAFTLTAPDPWFNPGAASLRSSTPEWQPGFPAERRLGEVPVDGEGTLAVGDPVASALLVDLYDGRELVFEQPGAAGRPGVSVSVSGVNFRALYSRFNECTAALLPATFERIARSSIAFDQHDFALGEAARARLDLIAEYLRADDGIKAVYVDGHSDGGKGGESDLELSRRRAEVVADYLIEQRIPEKRLIVRYHAERYPVAPNTTAEGREEPAYDHSPGSRTPRSRRRQALTRATLRAAKNGVVRQR